MDICPFLGLIEDAQTPALFPFERNCCHHVRKPAPLDIEYQSTYCLAPVYRQCQVFLSDSPSASLPLVMRAPRPLTNPRSGLIFRGWLFWLFVASLIFGLTVLYWQSQSGLPNPPLPTRTVIISTPSVVPVIISTPVRLDTPSASPVPAVTLTLTPTVYYPPGVETPIGSSPQLLIHRVLQGESLPVLATRYGTSLKAIQKINFYLPVPLWEGWMVVVPLNTHNVDALPEFETFQVKESHLTLVKVAQFLDADLDLVKKFNRVKQDDVLPVDSWLLIPRQVQKTP